MILLSREDFFFYLVKSNLVIVVVSITETVLELSERENTQSNFETTKFLAMTNLSRDAELQNAINDWVTSFPRRKTGCPFAVEQWLVFCDWLMI